MGYCCSKEERDHKLDTKEANLEVRKEEESPVQERAVKESGLKSNAVNEEAEFLEKFKEIKSHNEQINVLTIHTASMDSK